jgi:SAM-dependent methyltransferase
LSNNSRSIINALRERRLKQVPPRLPSADTLTLFDKILMPEATKYSPSKWGLLGCTPEIRTLAGRCPSKVTCIDHDQYAYSAYLPLCKPSEHEEFLCSDWLEINHQNAYDIVIGDGSMSMLPISNHEHFLKSVYQILKPGGLAVLRIFTYGKSVFKSPEDILKWYKTKMTDSQIDFATMFYFNFLWIDLETLRTSPEIVKINIKDLVDNKVLSEKEFNDLEQIDYGKVHLQYTLKELFESQIVSYFDIENIVHPEDYPDWQNTPIYSLRKKIKR